MTGPPFNLRPLLTAAPIALLAAAAALAQPASTRPATTPDAGPAGVVDRQRNLRDQVARLEDRLFQISQAIRKSEPDKAARLLEALQAAKGMGVRRRMDEIIERLTLRKYSDAVDAQAAIQADLQALLKLLTEEPERLEEREKEIRRLEELQRRLGRIIEEQRDEKSEAQATAEAARRAELLAAAIARAQALLSRQQELSRQTERNAGAPEALVKRQRELGRDTEALARDVRAMESAPSSKPPDPQRTGDPSPSAAADELARGAEAMKSAESSLQAGRPESARDFQGAAERHLQQAMERLGSEAGDTSKSRRLGEQAERQQQTADRTRNLARDMKAGPSASDAGGPADPPEGKSPDERNDSGDGDATPGRRQVEEAVPHQEQAGQKLKENNPREASGRQDQALKKLEDARQQLADKLEQLRNEQREELLVALEARFRAMLDRQVEVTRTTQKLGGIERPRWQRSDELLAGELPPWQAWVADEADKVLFLLKEEGTTVAFPEIVAQIRDDARDVAERLAGQDFGEQTRAVQHQIEQALRELIEAVKQQQESGESSGGQGGESDDTSPLLPGSAELKLLRACQLRVNDSTRRIDAARSLGLWPPDQFDEQLRKLTRRQREVAELARKLHENMQNRPQ